MWVIGKAFRRPHRIAHCRFARATGTAVSQGFRTVSRVAADVPHRYATRSWPKTLGSRLYGSFSVVLGIRPGMRQAAVIGCETRRRDAMVMPRGDARLEPVDPAIRRAIRKEATA